MGDSPYKGPAIEAEDATRNRKFGPIDPSQRELIKHRFLDAMSKTNIIQAALDAGGITRHTYLSWVKDGYITQEDLDEALARFLDYIRSEIAKRTFVGTPRVMKNAGKVMTDKDGNPMYEHRLDNQMLIKLAEKYLPEWKEINKTEIVQVTASGIPPQFEIIFDMRELNTDQINVLKAIAGEVREKRQAEVATVIESTLLT